MASFSEHLSVAQQVARIKRKIKAVGPAIKPAAQMQIEEEAAKLSDKQKSYAPVEEGDLRAGLDWNAIKGKVGAIVFASDWKSRWQEFGTEKMKANPFFFPPWRANKKQIWARIRKAIRSGAKKAVT